MLVGAELASGLLGLLTGSPDMAAVMLAHRAAGYAILVLLVWKRALVLRSLGHRRAGPPRYASLALVGVLGATLSLGLAWSLAGPYSFALFSGLSWHIYVGALIAPVLAWHTYHYTRRLPLSFWVERRSFLRLAGLGIVGIVLMKVGEVGASATGLATPSRRFTGSYPDGGAADGKFPVVSWLNDSPAPVDIDAWRLTIGGAVGLTTAVRYGDLRPGTEVTATIDCTGGWYSEQHWRGVPLADLLRTARPSARAASVTVTSATGYYRRFSMDEAGRYILATHVGGRALSHGHGFPLRLVAAGKRGFEWVKWVDRIDVNESPSWLQPPLPLQ